MKCLNRLSTVIFLFSFFLLSFLSLSIFAGTPAKWTYAAYGNGIGDRGIITGAVGNRLEIYAESGSYWYAMVYNASKKTYEHSFVSHYLHPDGSDDIIALRLGEDAWGTGKEIVLATREGKIHIFDQATKKLLNVLSIPLNHLNWVNDFEIADVDADGKNEFILASQKKLSVYSASGTLEWEMDIESRDIVVGQMDDDSGLEIAVAPENYYSDSGYIIDCATRSIQWTHPKGFGSGYFYAELAAVDIDNDNRDELVNMEQWNNVFAFDVEQQQQKWHIPTNGENGAMCLNDIDNDSTVELLLGQNQYNDLTAYDTVTLGKEWAFERPTYGFAGIEVADVNGDGKKEVLWGNGFISGRQDTFFVADWQSLQVEWQSENLGGPFTGPESGDLDGDGKDEVVVLAYDTRPGFDCGRLQVFDANGKLRAMSQPIMNDKLWVDGSRINLYDVDKDGKMEILVSGAYIYDGVIEIYDFNAGNSFDLIWTNSSRPSGALFSSVTAGDIDGDGQIEIIGGVEKEHSGCIGIFVYVYEFKTGNEKWRSLLISGGWDKISAVEVGDVDNDGNQEIVSLLDEQAVYVIDGKNKALDAIVFGSYTALTLIDTDQPPPSIMLGDDAGNLEILAYSGGSFQSSFKKNYSGKAIDGISKRSSSEEFIFGSGGTLNLADSNGIKWSSANYGPVYGKWAAIPKGSTDIFSAGSYSINSFGYTHSISISSPNGGEEWTRGASQTISWTSSGAVGDVKIEYSSDNGSSWSTIVSSTANDGTYAWTVPDAVSSQCLVRISENGGSLVDTSDAVFSITAVSATPPAIYLNRHRLTYTAVLSGSATGEQSFTIGNSGGGVLEWSVSPDQNWLKCTPDSGTGYGVVKVRVATSGMAAGNYTGVITVSDLDASNSPQTVTVNLTIIDSSQTQPPFGIFATPQDGALVSGSIPVTGWALDDLEVVSVKIYNGSSFVGDAVFVEGARPDVEQAYPTYPNNYKAGWGYMLLTNFLPGGGNGTYTLHAKATDKEGNEVILGSKTITVDNANAIKPFGAIDTPGQGGIASGNKFINWGWVLTPQPNKIPIDGSTIDVWIDGVKSGHPVYNIYRSDIADKFPGYANSDHAVGYFHIDTTAYQSGVHTIQWTARDSGGNSDGIGSRYFTIQNTGADASNTSQSNRYATQHPILKRLPAIPIDHSFPVTIKKGFDAEERGRVVYPSQNGVITIEIKELERLEIHLAPRAYQAYNVSDLPLGSHLDIEQAVFYWQPGPGFVGNYPLEFVKENENGSLTRITLLVEIIPKY